jgi:hypothetical protein
VTVTDYGLCADLRATDFGSIWLLTPLSEAGREWCDEHLPENALTWGSSVVVEPRYVADIVLGAADDGLVIAGEDD